MKRKINLIALITSAALFMLWSNLSTENSEEHTHATTICGNKTIDGDFVLNDGRISPGFSPGKITIDGNFTMGGSATYTCELKDLTGAGTGHDQIDVTGSIALDGVLNISLDGYIPDNADQFEILKYGTSLTGTFSSITGLPAGWQIDYGVLAPNVVTIYGPGSVLPVELLNFTVRKQKETLVLFWQTTSEFNSDYFNIEHSRNGKDFFTLERIQAQGTTSVAHDYSYQHLKPVNGINYYRLKQVDFDGKSIYSNIVSAAHRNEEFSFYPNPASQSIHFNQPVALVVIYDFLGREILRKENVNTTIDLSKMESGIYQVDVNQGEYKERLVLK